MMRGLAVLVVIGLLLLVTLLLSPTKSTAEPQPLVTAIPTLTVTIPGPIRTVTEVLPARTVTKPGPTVTVTVTKTKTIFVTNTKTVPGKTKTVSASPQPGKTFVTPRLVPTPSISVTAVPEIKFRDRLKTVGITAGVVFLGLVILGLLFILGWYIIYKHREQKEIQFLQFLRDELFRRKV